MDDKYVEEDDRLLPHGRQRSPLREPNYKTDVIKPTVPMSFSKTPRSVTSTAPVDDQFSTNRGKAQSLDSLRTSTGQPVHKPSNFVPQSILKHGSSVGGNVNDERVYVNSQQYGNWVNDDPAHKALEMRHLHQDIDALPVKLEAASMPPPEHPPPVPARWTSSDEEGSRAKNTTFNAGKTGPPKYASKKQKHVLPGDAAAKIKEIIAHQREQAKSLSKDPLPPTVKHSVNDLVLTNSKEVHHVPVPCPRKIAAGPAAPHYKGFNETETTYKTAEGKIVKLGELKRQKYVKRAKLTQELTNRPRTAKPNTVKTPESPQQVKNTRIVSAKPTRTAKHQDLITPQSWRIDHALVKKSIPKMGDSPPTSDKPQDKPLSHSKVLSEDAKNMLEDLQSDHSDIEKTPEPVAKKPSPRKKRYIPPVKEVVKEEDRCQKVRHYKQTDTQEYIQKKRQERLKQQRQQKQEAKLKEERRQRNLAELMKKTKMSQSHQHKVGSQQPHCKDQQQQGLLGSSDKENMLGSSGGSRTSSGSLGLEEEGESTDTIMDTTDDTDHSLPSNHAVPPSVGALTAEHPHTGGIGSAPGDLAKADTADSGIAGLHSTINVQDIMSKYGKDLGAIKDRRLQDADAAMLPVSSVSAGGVGAVLNSGADKKQDRKMAIYQMSMSLRDRISNAAAGTTTATSVAAKRPATGGERWAYPRAGKDDGKPFVSRYDVGTHQHDVFQGTLPGTSNIHKQALDDAVSEEYNKAAVTIQAAYRGHTVRQALSPGISDRPATGAPRYNRQQYQPDGMDYADVTDDSLSDSYNIDYVPKVPQSYSNGLASQRGNMKHVPTPALQPHPRSTATHRSTLQSSLQPDIHWDASKPDQYSIMNILNRKTKSTGLRPDNALDESSTETDVSYEEDFTHYTNTHPHTETHTHAAAVYSGTTPRRPTTSLDVDGALERANQRKAQRSSSNRTPVNDTTSESDNTLNDTLTPSLASDLDTSEQQQLHQMNTSTSTVSKPSPYHLDLPSSTSLSASGSSSAAHGKGGEETARGDRGEGVGNSGSSRVLPSHAVITTTHTSTSASSASVDRHSSLPPVTVATATTAAQPTGKPSSLDAPSGRMSPASLERRMTAELHLLDSMDVSIGQLGSVEHNRAVTMAQQESVSLAQILKAQKQAHEQDMRSLQLKAHQEALEASRSIEESRRKHNDASQRQGIQNLESLQTSTQALIKSQAEAAQATAQAARQLAEAKLTAGGSTSYSTEEHQRHLETISAATAAGVIAGLQNTGLGAKAKAIDNTDRGTQYSLASNKSSRAASSRQDTSYGSTSYTKTSAMSSSSSQSSSTSYNYDTSTFQQSSTASKPTVNSTSATASIVTATTGKTVTGRTITRVEGGSSSSISSSSARSVPDGGSSSSVGSGGTVRTASDVTTVHTHTHSSGTHSISTASNVHTTSSPPAKRTDHTGSTTESIATDDEINTTKDDYSQTFESSITDETFDQSIRDVLPAKDQQTRIRRHSSNSEMDYTSDNDISISSTTSSRRLSFGESDSFSRFTLDMVNQYMKEVEVREQHQSMMLKLRKQAIKEKTKAELAWLEQQKSKKKNKGADESYPLQKKRKVLQRLQKEQGEIRRLQDAQRVFSEETKLMMKQSADIAKMRHTTQQMKEKLHKTPIKDTALSTEDELSSIQVDEDSDISQVESPRKEDKSSMSPEARMRHKMNINFDKKYMTVREQKLQERRRCAEELLAWKKKLDEEEAKVVKLEQEALDAWKKKDAERAEKAQGKAAKKERAEAASPSKAAKPTKPEEPSSSSKKTSSKTSKPAADSSVSSAISESIATESYTSPTSKQSLSSTSSSSTRTAGTGTGSTIREESSIAEQITTATPSKKRTAGDGTDDAVVSTAADSPITHTTTSIADDYGSESFDSESTKSQTKSITTHQSNTVNYGSSEHSPQKLSPANTTTAAAGTPITTGKQASPSPRRYEDSETTSDLSDVEGRVQALNEELERRKQEVERLTKEKKKRKHEKLEKMRKKELTLKKELEAYNSIIHQVKDDLKDDQSSISERARPIIKQPTSKTHSPTPSPTHSPTRKTSDSYTSIHSSIAHDESSRDASSTETREAHVSEAEKTRDLEEKRDTDQKKEKSDEGDVSEDIEEDVPTSIDESLTSEKSSESKSYHYTTESSHSSVITTETVTKKSTDSSISHKPHIDVSINNTESTRKSTDVSKHSSRDNRKSSDATDEISESIVEEEVASIVSEHEGEEQINLTVTKADSKADKDADDDVSSSRSVDSKQSDNRDDDDVSHSSQSSYTSVHTDSIRSSSSATYSKTEDLSKPVSSSHQYTEDFSSASHTTSKSSIHTDDDISEELSVDSQSHDVSVDSRTHSVEDVHSSKAEAVEDSSTPAVEAQVEDPLSEFSIGDRVLVGNVQPGTLRFKGTMSCASGFWGGIELDRTEGCNDGSKNGVVYFKCAPNRGIFAPPEKISALPEDSESEVASSVGEDIMSDISQHTVTDDDRSADAVLVAAEADKESRRQKTVDEITDYLTSTVLRDSLSVMSDISSQKSDDMSHEPMLMTDDQTPLSEEMSKEQQQQAAVDAATKGLLTEAIGHMISIRKKKQQSQAMQEDDKVPDEPKTMPSEAEQDSMKLPPLNLANDSQQSLGGDIVDDDLDQMYEDLLTSSTGYIEDDFSFAATPNVTIDKSKLQLDLSHVADTPFLAVPHTLEQVNDMVSDVVNLFWEKRRYGESWDDLSPPMSYYTSPRLSDRSADSKMNDNEKTNSSHVYKKLIFDVTSEMLCDMYSSERDEDQHSLLQPKQYTRTQYTIKHPPTTVDVLKPRVQSQVAHLLGLAEPEGTTTATSKPKVQKWSSRKKKDHVDLLLLDELKGEEPDWVNYDTDELTVKSQLADAIFDSLLVETGRVCMDVLDIKRRAR